MATGSEKYAKSNAKVKTAIAERTAAGYVRTRAGIKRTDAKRRSPTRAS